jgi:hypothetical protein
MNMKLTTLALLMCVVSQAIYAAEGDGSTQRILDFCQIDYLGRVSDRRILLGMFHEATRTCIFNDPYTGDRLNIVLGNGGHGYLDALRYSVLLWSAEEPESDSDDELAVV